MIPKVTIYNNTSLDGMVTGFEVNMDRYYGLSSEWGNDAVLIGSETVLKAIPDIEPEMEEDKYARSFTENTSSPFAVFIDSGGKIRSHHIFRRLPYIREVIVMISRRTPQEYRDYLEEREYPFIETGDANVDLAEALKILGERFGVKRPRSDSGGGLNSVLLDRGLVDRIVVLLDPVIVGSDQTPFFNRLEAPVKLELEDLRKLENGSLLIAYKVDR